MVLREALRYGEESLEAAEIADYKIDAFTLLEMETGIDRTKYLLYPEKEISNEQFEDYKKLIVQRAEHVPCQYITGVCEFMGHSFKVNPSVLIPRQDTEILVEEVLKVLTENAKVLDMCTGSGAIAIALSLFRPDITLMAADISTDALGVAKENCADAGCNIEFVKSDLFENIDPDIKFDAIVSNPPYVSDSEYESLMPEVKDHEPALALKAGTEGLDIYERLIQKAPVYLNEKGLLAMEIGCSQAAAVSEMMKNANFTGIKVIKDLAGLDRVVMGWLGQ